MSALQSLSANFLEEELVPKNYEAYKMSALQSLSANFLEEELVNYRRKVTSLGNI